MNNGGNSMRNTQKTDYDDWTLEHCDDLTLNQLEEQQTEDLVKALVDYCHILEKQVVDLRCRVNRLTPSNQLPFPGPHSDLYESFCDYAAYPKFKHILDALGTEEETAILSAKRMEVNTGRKKSDS
jgi:hypothetical protein